MNYSINDIIKQGKMLLKEQKEALESDHYDDYIVLLAKKVDTWCLLIQKNHNQYKEEEKEKIKILMTDIIKYNDQIECMVNDKRFNIKNSIKQTKKINLKKANTIYQKNINNKNFTN